MLDNFAAFILTHGRADRVLTYKTLRDHGYTGRIVLVVDDEDDQLSAYQANFEEVVVFSKEEIAKSFDSMDLSKDRRTIVYARNACFQIAESLGVEYFIELDDDYTDFSYRIDENFKFRSRKIRSLDKIFQYMLEYYQRTNILVLAMAQRGDFIGGANSAIIANGIKPRHKAMNTLICSTKRPMKFTGRINEDVNTYVDLGTRGHLLLTVPLIAVNQLQTQQNAGGMTEMYIDSGTYWKSFYSVMAQPSCVKISSMGFKEKRIHHKIKWGNTIPKILHEKHSKSLQNV